MMGRCQCVWKAALLLVLSVALPGHAEDDAGPNWYRVEILVLVQRNANLALEEDWPLQPALEYPPQSRHLAEGEPLRALADGRLPPVRLEDRMPRRADDFRGGLVGGGGGLTRDDDFAGDDGLARGDGLTRGDGLARGDGLVWGNNLAWGEVAARSSLNLSVSHPLLRMPDLAPARRWQWPLPATPGLLSRSLAEQVAAQMSGQTIGQTAGPLWPAATPRGASGQRAGYIGHRGASGRPAPGYIGYPPSLLPTPPLLLPWQHAQSPMLAGVRDIYRGAGLDAGFGAGDVGFGAGSAGFDAGLDGLGELDHLLAPPHGHQFSPDDTPNNLRAHLHHHQHSNVPDYLHDHRHDLALSYAAAPTLTPEPRWPLLREHLAELSPPPLLTWDIWASPEADTAPQGLLALMGDIAATLPLEHPQPWTLDGTASLFPEDALRPQPWEARPRRQTQHPAYPQDYPQGHPQDYPDGQAGERASDPNYSQDRLQDRPGTYPQDYPEGRAGERAASRGDPQSYPRNRTADRGYPQDRPQDRLQDRPQEPRQADTLTSPQADPQTGPDASPQEQQPAADAATNARRRFSNARDFFSNTQDFFGGADDAQPSAANIQEQLQALQELRPKPRYKRRPPRRLELLVDVPRAFVKLPAAELEFLRQARQLNRAAATDVLFHAAWLQPMPGPERARPIILDSVAPAGSYPELQGTVRLYGTRYLHVESLLWLNTAGEYLDTDEDWLMPPPPLAPPAPPPPVAFDLQAGPFWLSQPSQLSQLSQNRTDGAGVETDPALAAWLQRPLYPYRHAVLLNQRRRMRSGELHYIDHPMFGVIIKVSRHEFPPVTAEEAQEP